MEAGQDGRILFSDEKTVLGINLGADFTAEHEHGIEDIIKAFGLPCETELGYEAMRVTKVPDGLWHEETGSNSLLVYDPYLSYRTAQDRQKTIQSLMRDSLSIEWHNFGKGFVGAWDDSSFGVNVDKRVNPDIAKTERKGSATNARSRIVVYDC